MRKKFTVANLKADSACRVGMEFVTPLIKQRKSVALALLRDGHPSWLAWAEEKGYDLSPVFRAKPAEFNAWAAQMDKVQRGCTCGSCSLIREYRKRQRAKRASHLGGRS